MREADDARLTDLVAPRIEAQLERALTEAERTMLHSSMKELKVRAKTLVELAQSALFFFRSRPIPLDAGAMKLLQPPAPDVLREAHKALAETAEWNSEALEATVRTLAERLGLGLGKVAQPLRAALTGSNTSPGIFDVLVVLGREESLGRIEDVITSAASGQ